MVSNAKPMKFGRMKLHPATVLRQTSRPRPRRAGGSVDTGAGVSTIVAMSLLKPPGHDVPGGRSRRRRAHRRGPFLADRHLLRTVVFAWLSASAMAASIVLLPDKVAEWRALRMSCRPAVYLETGFSGL